MAAVEGLTVAPVKALATVPRQRVRLEEQGVAEDRRLFLAHADDSVATLRHHPELTRVVPDLDLPERKLRVTLPDGTTATSSLDSTGRRLESRIFGKDRSGHVLDGPVADALSHHVGRSLRVVLAEGGGIGWDEGPVSLLGTASVADVLPPEVPGVGRFRMLVELGDTEPYEEDTWVGRRVRLGGALVRVTHSLKRCVVMNHSPVSGARDRNVLRGLVARRGRDLMCLGVIAEVVRPGDVALGDPVEVTSGGSE
ncbi:MOSC domain-containing protein [Halosaccharopolyspora lacisalsi]|uniref:MOSC domain-containing protein n=1 Tax=Halosaccharopolyspora lacisalsi TaxID=1000566 RepID=UPI0015FC12D6|nr:MOSC N-terminal beta barrel domain-containing protein [Halosaccharopolyspora lacisalsi]